MAHSERHAAQLIETFGTDVPLMLMMAPHYYLYKQIGAVPGRELQIRLRLDQPTLTPGVFKVTVKSETEVQEEEMEKLSQVLREEFSS